MTEIDIQINDYLKLDFLKIQKMAFIFNALEDGWTIKKKKKSYIFTKNHEGKKKVFLDSYLTRFMLRNFSFDNLKKDT